MLMIFRWRPTMGNTTKNKLNSFFCRFYSTLLNISLRRFALSDIYKVKCSFWFLTTVHLHGRRIHRAYRQTSWRLCAHGVDVHMYIYNFSLFFSPFFSVFFFFWHTPFTWAPALGAAVTALRTRYKITTWLHWEWWQWLVGERLQSEQLAERVA